VTKDDEIVRVKTFIASFLESRLFAMNLSVNHLHDDLDLRAAGLLDSLGFVQLVTELETRLGRAVDLADLAPEQLTTVGPLVRHIAWRHTAS
jgi:acyl carrier protein